MADRIIVSKDGQTGSCEGFEGPCSNAGTWRRQNTMYHNDEENWRCYCPECQEAADKYWDDMWEEFHRDVLGGTYYYASIGGKEHEL